MIVVNQISIFHKDKQMMISFIKGKKACQTDLALCQKVIVKKLFDGFLMGDRTEKKDIEWKEDEEDHD